MGHNHINAVRNGCIYELFGSTAILLPKYKHTLLALLRALGHGPIYM